MLGVLQIHRNPEYRHVKDTTKTTLGDADYLGFGVNGGVVTEKEFGDLDLVVPGGEVKWRLAAHRRLVHRGTAALQQQLHQLRAPDEGGHVEWRQTGLGRTKAEELAMLGVVVVAAEWF